MTKKIIFLVLLNLLIIPYRICTAPGVGQSETEKKLALFQAEHERELAVLREAVYRRGEFERWRDSLYLDESEGIWTIINEIGCMGLPQFMASTLHSLGYTWITADKFRTDPSIFPPDLQDEAFEALVRANWTRLEKFEPYLGTVINGVEITKSGMLAAAHLGGAKSVSKYLLTNGTYIYIEGMRLDIEPQKSGRRCDARDRNNTHVSDYIRDFAGYDI